VTGSPAGQALGKQPSGAEIKQSCAGLKGTDPVGVAIVKVCGSLAFQALGTSSSGDYVDLRGVCLGMCSRGGAE
jgi:hypothetical protein